MENMILILILIISIYTDIRSRRIFNIVTVPAVLAGLFYHIGVDGGSGFFFSSLGFFVGLALLFIPFAMGGIGAGDVKLLAAIGALKGTSFVFYTFLYGAIIGGLMALFILVKRKHFKGFVYRMASSLILLKSEAGSLDIRKDDLAPSLPYGVAIALGAVCTYFLEGV
ncbi:A24 family peptidase [Thalassobacillus devorans]|uniref:A24 family peptidase n=1 Tax=Thalassobacillus devorans TaxID=279813 RepID=UPI000491859B|nr:prepilin peptidase [Thalassobacillus devorans]